ncbi:MAG: radical SAM protein [Anaerolineales bacterium]|nr:radical SAM protein [Anaerolineales bacterium]
MIDLRTITITGEPGKFIIFRPLLGLAFVGNRAMADLASRLATGGAPAWESQPPGDALDFLRQIGFDQPDPPTPQPPLVTATNGFNPTTAVLLMTNQCHLRCIYCYADAGTRPPLTISPQVGFAAIETVCQNAIQGGQESFSLSFHGGGEPTFAWHVLRECVEYARSRPLPVRISLTSNGVWSPAMTAWIIQNIDSISFSFDGTPATQDRQRIFPSGQGSSLVVLRSLRVLDEHDFPYSIRMTVLPPWESFVDDVRYLCQQTGCRAIQVEPAFNTIRGMHAPPSDEQWQGFAETFLEAHETARQCGKRLRYSGARIETVTAAFCSAPTNALIVNPLGDLVTCYQVDNREHPLASISVIGCFSESNLNVDNTARQHLVGLIAERRAACQDCFCYWSCAGDCYSRNFHPGPDGHLIFSQRCAINRAITERLLLEAIAESRGAWRRGYSLPPSADVLSLEMGA